MKSDTKYLKILKMESFAKSYIWLFANGGFDDWCQEMTGLHAKLQQASIHTFHY